MSKELSVLRRTLHPAESAISGLRLERPGGQVCMSPLARLYLGDVVDHIHMIVETIDSLEEDAKMLIDLIFNTIK